ncbi:MAG: carboxypeptidase-like regulatory domain-containing protein [Gemmataceae bacterium]|nr:carboxypeptidase-like regulatory domain-containing protein [Gemmataceae bacterium]MDW8264738.1 carboxypeptidase-like regulatory domain-containing protein [Gemmataceae bacterium]
MKPSTGLPGACAVLLLGIATAPASAAWNNVFQVCCASCGTGQSAAYVAASPTACPNGCCCPPCCPQPVCCTQYVQRACYTPVTTYYTKTYYEPVTTYRTSYYYEPVVSYRYSCYFDPCTCTYRQVACPQTCYRLRSQCCASQVWVQRCCQVPVTTYRVSYYYEPVTTCYTPGCCPSTCCPTACCPTSTGAPTVTEQQSSGTNQLPPVVNESRSAPPTDSSQPYTPPSSKMPMKENSFNRPPMLPPPAPPPPAVRLDRIVMLPERRAQVEGQVVREDRSPKAGAQVMFVSMDRQGPQQTVTADADGKFRTSLASGSWLVYVPGADGRPVFHSKIDVRGDASRTMTLVSR